MMMHGGPWWGMMQERPAGAPKIDRQTARRAPGYARPYAGMIAAMTLAIRPG